MESTTPHLMLILMRKFPRHFENSEDDANGDDEDDGDTESGEEIDGSEITGVQDESGFLHIEVVDVDSRS